MGTEQTTYEFEWDQRLDKNWIFLKWEKWVPGKPWLDWHSAKEVDLQELAKIVAERLRTDAWFISSLKWEKWESIKGDPGTPGKNWEKPDEQLIIESVYEHLVENETLLNTLRWKDWYTPVRWKDYFDGKDWEPWKSPVVWVDFERPIDWENGWEVVFVEDINKISLGKKQLGIDKNKNIYIWNNNTLLQL